MSTGLSGEQLDAPNETFDYYGEPCGIWGQSGPMPYGSDIDPVPTVYASGHGGGEVSVYGEYRLSLDQAESYAERILTAVRWQRAVLQREKDAALARAARGNGATHDWDTSHPGLVRCRNCRVRASSRSVERGEVPVCSPDERCRKQPWHEIVMAIGIPNASSCMFCESVYPSTTDPAKALLGTPEETQ